MAWDQIPTDKKTCGDIANEVGMDSDHKAEVMTLWAHLEKHYPKELLPLAFEKSTTGKKRVLVARVFEKEHKLKIEDIKKAAGCSKLKVDFGNGSRGNRGSANQGNKFEVVLARDINKWFEEGDTYLQESDPVQNMIRQIALIQDNYGWFNNRTLRAKVMGGVDTKRPLKLKNGTWFVGDAGGGQGYDIGEKISDVTVEGDKSGKTYISAKTSATTALVNLGVRTNYFPIDDIKAGSIKKSDGQALLNTFGLDEEKFCKVYNFANAKAYGTSTQTFNETETPGDNFDYDMLTALIKGSLGYGFHYVHKMGTKILHMEMTESFLEKSCVPNKGSIQIQYGGTGGDGAKRVNIVMTTDTLELQFNIRNTSNKKTAKDEYRIYPTHLQAGYKFKGEVKMTHFWEASTDTFSGVSTKALKMIN